MHITSLQTLSVVK
jgi:hypothetical protein